MIDSHIYKKTIFSVLKVTLLNMLKGDSKNNENFKLNNIHYTWYTVNVIMGGGSRQTQGILIDEILFDRIFVPPLSKSQPQEYISIIFNVRISHALTNSVTVL